MHPSRPDRRRSTPSPKHPGLRGALLAAAGLLVACGSTDPRPDPAEAPDAAACAAAAPAALADCLVEALDAERACATGSLAPCPDTDSQIVAAVNALASTVESACANGGAGAAGFGAETGEELADRLGGLCRGEARSLSARVFGGPRVRLLEPAAAALGASPDPGVCLPAAYEASARLLVDAFTERAACLADPACSSGLLDVAIAELRDAEEAAVDTACGDGAVSELLGYDAGVLSERALRQSECALAASHPDAADLAPTCGPGAAPALERGVATQVVLDEAVWGTRCGDGGPYAFYVRLAPEGFPVDDVVFMLEGGGVCIAEGDCGSVLENAPGLFSALDDALPPVGLFNPDAFRNPFANWTHVWLPYCTQDVFAGGGATQTFSEQTVERFGAVDAQAAMAMVRNILWRELDATRPGGYRPEDARVLLTGVSAGGFGVLYNYHYPLDELRWVRTTAAPDSSLALDSGELLSVRTLGAVNQSVWRSRPVQAPYCQASECALGPVIARAHAERLLEDPLQQLLQISPQADGVQRSTTGFPSIEAFVNEARRAYCEDTGTPGLHWYLDDIPAQRHVLLLGDEAYFGSSVAGTTLPDWLDLAMTNPTSLEDAVAEGDLVDLFPGVLPFECGVD